MQNTWKFDNRLSLIRFYLVIFRALANPCLIYLVTSAHTYAQRIGENRNIGAGRIPFRETNVSFVISGDKTLPVTINGITGDSPLAPYIKGSNWDVAIYDFSKRIEESPNATSNYFYRALAFVETGRINKAIDDLDRAIQLDPKSAASYSNRASAYMLNGDISNALEDWKAALRLDKTYYMVYHDRADGLGQKGRFKEAIPDWNEWLRVYPNDAGALVERGRTHFMLDEFPEATNDCIRAIRIAPDDPAAYNGLAWLRATCADAKFRDGRAAVQLATKACELSNWRSWDYIDTLAAAYAEAGDFENAIKYQKQASEMPGLTDEERTDGAQRLALYQQNKPYREKN